MSTRPSNKVAHPGHDAMNALRSRAPRRSDDVIQAEKAKKAAVSQARAEAEAAREIAVQKLAEYENEIASQAKISEQNANNLSKNRTLPPRAARAVVISASNQLISTQGQNDGTHHLKMVLVIV